MILMKKSLSHLAASFGLVVSDGTLSAFCLIKALSNVQNMFAVLFFLKRAQ